jgi:GTP-binding protein EngB required for normal cell division
LAEYVTQKGNPGNVKKLSYVEIQIPAEILRRGLFFVDSPGLGSPIAENTETTERFLPSADAFVLVTSYESPLSEEEDRILQRLSRLDRKLFVVINKQDTVAAPDRIDALSFVKDRIATFSFREDPQIFSMSATQALAAKRSRSTSEMVASGLQEFEGALMSFLTEQKAQSFLTSTFDRTMQFLIKQVQAQEDAATKTAFDLLVGKLRDQRESICGVDGEKEHTTAFETDDSGVYPLEVEPKTGCRVCGAILQGLFRFLSKYQYEMAVNPETQQEHARRGGFCQLHTWQYEGISSPQGVCESYPRLVFRDSGRLLELANASENRLDLSEGLRKLLPSPRTCRVCEVCRQLERETVKESASAIRTKAEEENPHLPALCLNHLALVVDLLGIGSIVQTLIRSHARLLERTAEDLQRYAVKHDALRRYLTSEEERRASQLALLLLAGHRNLSGPWVVESII